MNLSWLGLSTRDHARLKGERSNHHPTPEDGDWHAPRDEFEPRCSADQWRTRDRNTVIFISEMPDSHLGHCVRFASTKPQHRTRLAALLAESFKRARS